MTEPKDPQIHELEKRVERLELLEKTARTLTATLDLEKLLNLVMETTKQVIQAEACSILLYEKDTGDLVFTVALGEKGNQVKEIRMKPGQGIAGWVLEQGQPLLIQDVSQDSRFYQGVDEKTGFITRSIIAVPLITKDEIIGVIEVLNKKGGGAFEESEKDILVDLSKQVAIAIDNARMTEELKQSKAKIEEYNRTLEQKVEERTQQLQQANEKLKQINFMLRRTAEELEKSNRELKETQAQLLQQEKLAAIGQLAAGVAHEINNPMAFVNSNLGRLTEYIEAFKEVLTKYEGALEYIKSTSDSKAQDYAQDIENFKKQIDLSFILNDLTALLKETNDGIQRVIRIVRDLKDFSRLERAEIGFANINKCLESTLNIIWNEIKYKAKLNKHYGELPDILCYPSRLNQVFLNILLNAAQAIPDQGEITIQTYQENGSIIIKITDTGIGIPEENLSRIFEPFFTTKEVGKGTGLGLSISYQIIKEHKGKISVSSKVGQGTTFTIELPVKGVKDKI